MTTPICGALVTFVVRVGPLCMLHLWHRPTQQLNLFQPVLDPLEAFEKLTVWDAFPSKIDGLLAHFLNLPTTGHHKKGTDLTRQLPAECRASRCSIQFCLLP